jgi:hypothetical protein
MTELGLTLALAEELRKLSRRSRYQWLEYQEASRTSPGAAEWNEYARTQHAIAALMRAINIATSKNADLNHIHRMVDSREVKPAPNNPTNGS